MAQTVSSSNSESKQKILDYLARRKQAYQAVFAESINASVVMADLGKFCFAGESTFHPDPRVDAMQEGRKQVYQRIANHLNLTEGELYFKYALGKNPPSITE